MTEEFNLSDKIQDDPVYPDFIAVEDVKEFIRLLKEEAKKEEGFYTVCAGEMEFDEEKTIALIDKLAGDKLI